jgi:hypothetical protein
MARTTFPHTFIKQLTLTPELMARVATYRHAGQFRYEMDAIRALLELGLEADPIEPAKRRAEARAA